IGKKTADEKALRERITARDELKDALAAFDRIAAAEKVIAENAARHNLLERGSAFNSELFDIARTLLRAGEERPKPNGERLREFNESGKVSLELALFSEKPVYTDLEILQLADSLTFFAAQAGAADPLCQKVLAGKSPH